MKRYSDILGLKGKRILDVGIAGDPIFPGATSPSEKYEWFGEGNEFFTLDNDRATKPDVVGDICSPPKNLGRFHLVILSEVLEHVFNFQDALLGANKVIVEGGHLIVTTPWMIEHHPTESTPDYWRFSAQALERVLNYSGFIINDMYSSSLIKGVLCEKV